MKLKRKQAKQSWPPKPTNANDRSSLSSRVSSFFRRLYPKADALKHGENGPDVVVAIMGTTGSGKSSFIANVTGRNDIPVGHDLNSGSLLLSNRAYGKQKHLTLSS